MNSVGTSFLSIQNNTERFVNVKLNSHFISEFDILYRKLPIIQYCRKC